MMKPTTKKSTSSRVKTWLFHMTHEYAGLNAETFERVYVNRFDRWWHDDGSGLVKAIAAIAAVFALSFALVSWQDHIKESAVADFLQNECQINDETGLHECP